jgi:tetratricopeptide (TPR) repeat protein
MDNKTSTSSPQNAPGSSAATAEKKAVSEQSTASASASGTSSKDASPGPPTTVWGIAAFSIAVMSAYSWGFKVWDKSEFPEGTFTSDLYWAGIAGLLFICVIWGSRVRRRKNWLDICILILGAIATIGTFTKSITCRIEGIPSDHQFAILIFDPRSDTDTKSHDAALRLRDSVRTELQNAASQAGLSADISFASREIKGLSEEEQLSYVRKWSRRGKGNHLAIWPEVEIKNGTTFSVKIHYVHIYDFGKQINSDAWGQSDHADESFDSNPIGDGTSVSQDIVKKAADAGRYYWGVASYFKADYKTAIGILPPGYDLSEYYLGRTALELASTTVQPRHLISDAIQHFQNAISLYEKDDSILAAFNMRLGDAYNAVLSSQTSSDFGSEIAGCKDAFGKAAQIYKRLEQTQNANTAEVHLAICSYNAYAISNILRLPVGSGQDLKLAKERLSRWLTCTISDGDPCTLAKSTLADIYSAEANQDRSIILRREVIEFYRKSGDRNGLAEELSSLGLSQAALAHQNEESYQDALDSYREAGSLCQEYVMCYQVHRNAARAGLRLVGVLKGKRKPFVEQLHRAREEASLAEGYISKTEQPSLFAEVRELTAQVDMSLAIEEKDPAQKAMLLRRTTEELSGAIATLNGAHVDATNLSSQRATCLRLLAEISK